MPRMVQTVFGSKPVADVDMLHDEYIQAFRWMLLARVLDEKMANLYRGGKIHGGVFMGKGQEALSAAVGMSLRKGDVFAPLIRDAAGRLAFGEPILDAVRTYLGSPLGPMRARDGNVHRGRPREGLLAMISHLGAMVAAVNGMLFARRLKGITGMVGATCLGDGATSTGAFHEALNQAAVERLPLVLVVANNQYAYSTPNSRQFACRDLMDKAVGYGVAGHQVDGTDLQACLKGVGGAVQAAREGRGPQLVVATLLRLCGHGEHDDASYVDPKIKASDIGRDCVKIAEAFLRQQEWLTEAELAEAWAQTEHQVEEAIATVQREGGPDPYKENWCTLSSKHLAEGYEMVCGANGH